WQTFSHGHTILWLVGIVTAFLTATYMFRLVFLAFHGERRHEAPPPVPHTASAAQAHAAGFDAHSTHDGHAAIPAHPEEEEPVAQHGGGAHAAHGGHLHDAPPAMALALILLAVGS